MHNDITSKELTLLYENFVLGPKEQGREFSEHPKQSIGQIDHMRDMIRRFIDKYCMADEMDPYAMDFLTRLNARWAIRRALEDRFDLLQQSHIRSLFIQDPNIKDVAEVVDLLPELAITKLKEIFDIADRGDKALRSYKKYLDEEEEREEYARYYKPSSYSAGPDGRGGDPDPVYEGPEISIEDDMNDPIEFNSEGLFGRIGDRPQWWDDDDTKEFYEAWIRAYKEGMEKRNAQ